VPLINFGEWRPDVTDYQGTTSLTIRGVVPRGDGYGPMLDSSPYTNALPGVCRGAFVIYPSTGIPQMFAGTSTRLYHCKTDLTWEDLSQGGVAYTALNSNEQWQFTQFNDLIIAVQANCNPQVYNAATLTGAFADLAGSPPKARYISTVNSFVLLSGLTGFPLRIQWSGLDDTTQWTPGVNSSDFQDLPDGGITRGVAGGESGLIFQDDAIRRMTFAPGTDYVFLIERISEDKGLFAPYSIIRAGERIFFLSISGLHVISPSQGYPVQVGKERFDRTILADIDRSNLQLCLGANDPRGARIFLAYKSASGTAGNYDKMICYDYLIDRATIVPMKGEFLAQMAQPTASLDALDGRYPNVDAMTISLDSFAGSTQPELMQFDTMHRLSLFGGQPIEGVIETAEEGTDGQRVRVQGLRPITDATTVLMSCSKRERTFDPAVYVSESAPLASGICPFNISTRYSRARLRVPAGTNWTYAAGVEPKFATEGAR
jgi:hypothetical protein